MKRPNARPAPVAGASFGLRISVAVNVALLATVLFLLTRNRPPEPAISASVPPVAHSEQTADAVRGASGLRAAADARRGPLNVPDTMTRLKNAGVSLTVLADIVKLDFRQRWNKRIVELENRYAPKQPPQREYVILQRQADAEQIRALEAALGEDGYLAWDRQETMRKVNFNEVPLAAAEADQVYHLQKQLEDKLSELQMAMEDGDADIADMGTLQMQAQEAYEKQLKELLGQERYDQIKGYVVAKVDGFMMFNQLPLSDDQTKALQSAASQYATREAKLESQLRDKPTDAATVAAQLQALDDARENGFRATLGADVYENLKRENDDTYQTLTQYAAAWNLNDSEIGPVYEKLKGYEDGVDLLRKAAQLRELAGQTADWKAINAAIDQSRQQTEATLQDMLGADRVQRLARNGLLSPLGSDRNVPQRMTGVVSGE